MSLSTSRLSKVISQSEIRNMSVECERVGGINLSQGICDVELPPPVKAAAKRAIDLGFNHYTRHDGLEILREAICEKLRRYNQIEAEPNSNVVVSCGATGSFYCTCLALLNSGDEVLLFEPYYGYHITTLVAAGAVPVTIPLNPPDWTFDLSHLEGVLTKRTRGIIICTPSNPCGKIFSMAELALISDFAIRHDLFIFTDEIYEYFVYDGVPHISPGSLEAIRDRTITISGYSKTFSVTGWRVGYVACDQKWASMIGYVNDLIYVCAPSPLQSGVAEGIRSLGSDYFDKLRIKYQFKRDRICNALRKVGITPYVPSGAYYVLADVSSIPGETSKNKALFILNKIGVASVPGSAFFSTSRGDNFVRFCFAKSDEILELACQRIESL
jgi:aminotransferase